MTDWQQLTNEIVKFRDERDWQQFHNSKDLAFALSSEALELKELFQWKKAEEADAEKVKDELAEVVWSACLADRRKIPVDISKIVLDKKLEKIYSRTEIVEELKFTKERISNKVCSMDSERYHVPAFARFK